jgi:hypothetical protein
MYPFFFFNDRTKRPRNLKDGVSNWSLLVGRRKTSLPLRIIYRMLNGLSIAIPTGTDQSQESWEHKAPWDVQSHSRFEALFVPLAQEFGGVFKGIA